MDPIDYEKCTLSMRADIDKDSMRTVLSVPQDDVELLEVVKKVSTVEPSKPEIE
jgi:hypothetical protein